MITVLAIMLPLTLVTMFIEGFLDILRRLSDRMAVNRFRRSHDIWKEMGA